MGKKEATIYDLAEILEISPATVSRALKDHPAISKKTKKRIQELAKEMGYRSNHFARNLRKQHTNTIGVIVPKLNSNFMSAVISGMENMTYKEGYNLIISQSSENAEKEIANAETMFNSRVDGLLVSLSYDTPNLEHYQPFFSKDIPVIFFDRVVENENCTVIQIDNSRAAFEATEHLIKQGCRNIAHITATQKRNVYVERTEGYKEALRVYGLPFLEENIIVNNLSLEAGMEAANQILSMSARPDGVFAANDNCAVGCMIALKKAGVRIPQEISFVGFNDDPVASVIEPNLTTVRYSGQEMGEVAARHLINHLKGISDIQSTNVIVLRSELVVRASSVRKK